MANHFTDIGFPMEHEHEVLALVRKAVALGERLSRHYVRWAVGAGVELWVLLDGHNTVQGITPYYAGTSHLPIRLERFLAEKRYPYEGRILAQVNPREDGDGDYPLVCDIPGSELLARGLSLPAPATLRVTAFADTLDYYPDDAAFEAAQAQAEAPCAAESFIPTGMFGVEEGQLPTPTGLLTGHLRRVEQPVNPVTERPFYALSVATFGGEFDLVADPAFFPQSPAVGGVVRTNCWLCGRVYDLPLSKPWWQQLFGG